MPEPQGEGEAPDVSCGAGTAASNAAEGHGGAGEKDSTGEGVEGFKEKGHHEG